MVRGEGMGVVWERASGEGEGKGVGERASGEGEGNWERLVRVSEGKGLGKGSEGAKNNKKA
jgi:hypothetical protein